MLETLRKLIGLLEHEGVDYALIGALALPAYGRVRATYDIDLAVAVSDMKVLRNVFDRLIQRGFEIPASPSLDAACAYLFDRENAVDVELWLEPDGILFDEETLRRRRRVNLSPDLSAWVLSPEDFVVNKLARRDRRAIDENDVVSVLERQKRQLDEKYLRKRAESADVLELLKAIRKRMRRSAT